MTSAIQIYEVDSVRIRVSRKVMPDEEDFDDRVAETVSIQVHDSDGNEIAHLSLVNHDPQPLIVVTFDDER